LAEVPNKINPVDAIRVEGGGGCLRCQKGTRRFYVAPGSLCLTGLRYLSMEP